MRVFGNKAASFLAALLFFFSAGAFAQTCTTTLSAGANIASSISSAAAGDTICLNSGSYSSITLGTYTKNPRVTIRSVTALGASIAGMTVGSGVTPNGLTFDGITWTGDVSFNGNNNAKNITIQNSAFGTNQLYVETQTYNNNNILFDANTHGAFDAGGSSGEGRISVRYPNGPGSNPSGVTITNSTLGPGGCSDGVQTGARGVTIGPGNTFTGIVQGSCSEHVDSIQGYGSADTVVTGNFFVSNTVAFGFYDGESTSMTITNNVVNGSQVCDLGSITNLSMRHNTLRNVSCRVGGINQSGGGTGIITDNIFHGGSINSGIQSSFGGTVTHNQFQSGGTGTNNIIGAPTYTGGSSPSTWAGWQLTTGSVGYNVASDSGDMGTLYYGAAAEDTGPPTAPTSPSATANSSSQITVSWTSSTEPDGDTITYNVRRCSGSGCTPSTIVQSTTSTSWANSGLTSSTLYRYTIDACDSIPNCSSQTSIVQATTNAPSSYTVTPSETLGASYGSISPSTPQTVTEGNTQAFTITPDASYQAIMGGTCGGSLVSSTYTTNAITSNCSVTAWFIPSACELTPNPQTPDSNTFTTQTGTFTYNVSVIPVVTNHDLGLGHVNGTWSNFTSFATVVLFNTSGVVQVRNGGSYAADAVYNYSTNTRYNVRFVVNISTHTYDVFIAEDGQAETQIANDYAFRTEQASVTQLTQFTHVLATGSPAGDYVCPLGLSTALAAPINLHWSPL